MRTVFVRWGSLLEVSTLISECNMELLKCYTKLCLTLSVVLKYGLCPTWYKKNQKIATHLR